jgi:glycosyltransferase involved in cell wall biosynthesis
MPFQRGLTFVVAVNNRELFTNNFSASPCFRRPHPHQILLQESFSSAGSAYNEALDNARNDLVVFAHQDIYFPEPWLSELQRALEYLDSIDPQWGVLGCFGVGAGGSRYGRVYSAGLGVIGTPIQQPASVQTLDEIVLIVRKSSGLRFDPDLPSFHFYGADICLRAAARGMKSYAIPAFCVHNTQMYAALPQEFYACYRYFKQVWRDCLPVHTSCITVSRFDRELYTRRLREAYITYVRRRRAETTRVANPRAVLEQLAERSRP